MRPFSKFLMLAMLCVPILGVQAATINVPLDHATIQAAINAATSGDTVLVADGVYNESLSINKSLTLEGNSTAGVIINAADSNTRGIESVSVISTVTLRNFTLNRPSSTNCTTTCFGIKIEGGGGHAIENVIVNNSPRSGVDLNGVTSATITDVTVNNTAVGNGIGLTDSSNITMTNITTSGNSFGGIAVYTGAGFFPTGSTGIVLTGVNSIGEANPMYYQKANVADPLSITATPTFNFVVLDATAGTETQGYFAADITAAGAGAVALENLLDTGNPLTPSTRLASPVVIVDLSDNSEIPDADTGTAGYQADTVAPIFDSLTAIARDTSNNPKAAVGGKFYLTENERIYFTVKIDPSDTMADTNNIDFTIGGDAKSTVPFLGTVPPAKAKTRNRNYFVQAGENGDVVLTALNFEDRTGNDITGTVLPNPTNIVVDTMAPAVNTVNHTSSGSWARYAKAGDTVTYDITFAEDIASLVINSASSATGIAAGPTTEVNLTSPTTAQLIFTVAAGDNGEVIPTVDFDITDIAGNVTTVLDLNPIMGGGFDGKIFADTTAPTLTVVSIASNNANDTTWAKSGDEVKIQITASEKLRTTPLTATIAGKTATVTKTCGTPSCETYDLTIILDGSETEGVVTFSIDYQDRAGNAGATGTATTDASQVTIDLTAPTVPTVAIASNNALDTTLAKTNDTVTVTFEIADNLSTVAALMGMPAATILSSAITGSNVTAVAPGQTIERFTDGSEDSEVVVPFSFAVRDIAGNVSALISATTDSSQVQFDRTDPVIRNVKISAISQDSSAYQGDIPTYYAKQNDKIRIKLQVCDYVDSQNNPPTGTLFGQAITLNDKGLVGAPGNCTTGDGNPSQWRKWQKTINNVDGTEGVVTFNITVNDNAGNQLVNVTGTTDSSQVIFDKTMPTVPTDVMDLGGVATPTYKPFEQADYSWSNETDPMGGTPVSGLYQNDLRYFNPNTGINEMVTLDYVPTPTQVFTPASVIPDIDPYIVFMNIRDKAGNASGETNTYEQRYGITMSGQILDNENNPVPNGLVRVIAEVNQTCDGLLDICAVMTDSMGNYKVVIAPNQTYTVDFYGTHFLYLEKQTIPVTTQNLEKSVMLELVEGNEIQTLDQRIVIITDTTFSDGNQTLATQVIVNADNGLISTEKIDRDSFKITSTGDINSVYSNNPAVGIQKISDNEFLVVGAGMVSQIVDALTFSTTGGAFASGDSSLGRKPVVGNGHSGSYSGMTREERLVHGDTATYEDSLAFANKINQGFEAKTHHYVNFNGYAVFAGYQKGRMALDDFDMRMENYVVFRGDKTGPRFQEFAKEDLEPQQDEVKAKFQTVREENGYRKRLAGVNNKNRYASLQTLETDKPIVGFRKDVDVYEGVKAKREYDDNYVNKFAKPARNLVGVAPTRMRQASPYNVYLKHNGRSVALGRIIDKDRVGPQVVNRDRADVFSQTTE